MSRRPHTAHRLVVLLGGVTTLVALTVLVSGHVALELAPAVTLIVTLAAGWLPGEERLARVLARRVAGRRITAGPAPLVRLRGPRTHGDRGLARSGARSSRGPPAVQIA